MYSIHDKRFAYESREARKTCYSKRAYQETDRSYRHLTGKTAKFSYIAPACSVYHRARAHHKNSLEQYIGKSMCCCGIYAYSTACACCCYHHTELADYMICQKSPDAVFHDRHYSSVDRYYSSHPDKIRHAAHHPQHQIYRSLGSEG